MNRPTLTVAFFSNEVVPGDFERHIVTLIKNLDRRHFHPVVIARPECIARLASELPSGVQTVSFCLHKLSRFMEAFRLWRVLRRHHVDVLHSHAQYTWLVSFSINRMRKTPLILETAFGHDRSLRSHLGNVDIYLASTSAEARRLIAEQNLPPEQVVVIPPGNSDARKTEWQYLRVWKRRQEFARSRRDAMYRLARQIPLIAEVP